MIPDAVGRAWRGVRGMSWGQRLPGAAELRAADKGTRRRDLVVGLSVAAVALPSSLGMADLAGLPATAGLYATMLPLLAYALFGSSRQLIVGPDGATAALTATTLAPLAAGSLQHYGDLALTLTLLLGVYLALGALLRLGFMADFLSKPVLAGYFNGVGLQIIAGQAGKLLGIKVPGNHFFDTVEHLIMRLPRTSLTTLALSVSLLVLGGVVKKLWPRAPVALIVVVVAIAASVGLSLSDHGVAVVGEVRRGLPVPTVPHVTLSDLFQLMLPAAGMALVSFGDAIAITRNYAARNGYEIVPGREFTGIGAANLVSAFTQGMPVSSSGSRTAVNDASGGRSQWVGISVAVIALLVAAFATPLLKPLPKAALGVVLILSAVGMISASGMVRLRRVHDSEAALALATMLAVLAFGTLGGLLIAVGLSIGVFVYRTVRPHDAVLGRQPDVDGYHDIAIHEDAQTEPGLVVYRFDAPLYFPNALWFRDRVREVVAATEARPDNGGPVRWLVANVEAVTYIDSTAVQMLRDLHDELAERGIVLALARAKHPLRVVLRRSGLAQVLGEERIFPTVATAVAAYLAEADAGSETGSETGSGAG
ncbi:SulP family inorganic anion transporter [Streptacidiphilus jiangxiensis]|uniref:Sulfate permease, SulP family n=1 Tax=Streptacidiphilus jiangxiensis TaxID=235985 RepID=A0A1H7HUL3_STRJI|nr:sulfate permease [Streptacidiphilus jiangxiensis]SEK53262.1 sulfate permease, SulP family [Streptacidiphilus jiangxiensis]